MKTVRTQVTPVASKSNHLLKMIKSFRHLPHQLIRTLIQQHAGVVIGNDIISSSTNFEIGCEKSSDSATVLDFLNFYD